MCRRGRPNPQAFSGWRLCMTETVCLDKPTPAFPSSLPLPLPCPPYQQFKKVQEIQKKTKELQEAMAVARIDGASASGSVTVVMSGEQMPVEVNIAKELMEEGAEKVGEWGTRVRQGLPPAVAFCSSLPPNPSRAR